MRTQCALNTSYPVLSVFFSMNVRTRRDLTVVYSENEKGRMKKMKLWIDDVRPMPEGYGQHVRSVNKAKEVILEQEEFYRELAESCGWEFEIELIDIDHDAGDYACDGGDYIKLLDWLEETGRNYPIRIHSMNPVGVMNMRAIIEKNGWTEVR